MTFTTQGFEITPLLSPREIEGLRCAVGDYMEIVSGALLKPVEETETGTPFDERIERIAETDQSFAQLLGSAVATDGFRMPQAGAIAHSQALAQLAERVAGCSLVDRVFRFRLNSSALPKARQQWHSDVARIDSASAVRVTAWIPLTDAGPVSGGLEIMPGDRNSPVGHCEDGGKLLIPADLLADVRTVVPTVPAGHCLFLDRYTPHRAVLNESGRTRWSLVVWFMDAVGEGM